MPLGGLSLNERAQGKRTSFCSSDEQFISEFPSFNAITECFQNVNPTPPAQQQMSGYLFPLTAARSTRFIMSPNSTLANHVPTSNMNKDSFSVKSPISLMNLEPHRAPPHPFGTPVVDPLLVQARDQYEAEVSTKTKTRIGIAIAGSSHAPKNKPAVESVQHGEPIANRQIIFSNAIENDFYITMTAAISTLESSPRIYECETIWVDQRTLTLSMMPGGWISPHVVDCFSKSMNQEQMFKGRQGLLPDHEIITYVVSRENMEKLMDPLLDHSKCIQMFDEQNVGFSLQNASLVLLPCIKDKRWVLIVANLNDKFFDILNPDFGADKFVNSISTVAYNFKQLFAAAYPQCSAFSIKQFDYRFIQVPKHKFRYDSGIFVLQYSKSYK